MGNKPIDFLVNIEANYLGLNTKRRQQSSASVAVTGVSGKPQQQAFLKPLECQLGGLNLTQSFLYMSDCPIPLLDWDLLCKVHAQVTVSPGKQQVHVHVPPEHALKFQMFLVETRGSMEEMFPLKIYKQISKAAWANGTQGWAIFFSVSNQLKEKAIVLR